MERIAIGKLSTIYPNKYLYNITMHNDHAELGCGIFPLRCIKYNLDRGSVDHRSVPIGRRGLHIIIVRLSTPTLRPRLLLCIIGPKFAIAEPNFTSVVTKHPAPSIYNPH